MVNKHRGSFALLSSLFFMWGFITVMNDVLINTFKGIFQLTPVQRSLVQFSFFGAFFIVSLIYFLISSSRGNDPINKIGYNSGMAVSLFVCGFGCLCFFPAALLSSYAAFLTALFILACGVTLLQICANPYAAILGSPESAPGRLNLAQGLNSLGTTLGPLVGTILIYKIFSQGEQTPVSVGKTYLIYGLFFIALGLFVLIRKMPSFVNPEKIEPGFNVLKFRHLRLGVLAIFFYVGAEVSVGSWLVEFLKSDTIMGMEEAEASYFLSYFWGGLMIGRLMANFSLDKSLSKAIQYRNQALVSAGVFLLIYFVTSIKYEQGVFQLQFLPFREVFLFLIFLLLQFVAFTLSKGDAARALVVFCICNCTLLLIAMFSSGVIAFWSLVGTGLFFSIGWSNIFTLAIRDLGKYTSQGSSLLVMAIVGGAIIPWLQSQVIQTQNIQLSFFIPLLALGYLIFYGIEGYKIKSIHS